jgi:hypothetical protein
MRLSGGGRSSRVFQGRSYGVGTGKSFHGQERPYYLPRGLPTYVAGWYQGLG